MANEPITQPYQTDPTLEALAALITQPSQADPALAMATQPSDVDFSRARPMSPEAPTDDVEQHIDFGAVPPAPTPGFDPAAEAAELGAPLPQSSGSSASVSTSAGVGMSGYSETKNQQIARGPGARLDAKMANTKAGVTAEYDPFYEAQIKNAADEKLAADKVVAAEQDRIMETARSKGEMAHLFNEFKAAEEHALQRAQFVAEGAKADYQAALANFGATQINPGQLWSRMDEGDQFSMGVNAFIHDFLQADGIKSSSMDTFNKGVDRNINAQISNLETKGKVAAGFKDLWEMQRMQSASDTEARTRIRGFALDSALKQVESQLGQYDSRLAGAKLAVAKVEIQKEMVKNLFEVKKQIDKAAQDKMSLEVQSAGDQLRASTAAAQMRSAERISANEIASREKMAAKPAEVAPDEGVLYDITKSGKGEAKWRIKKEYINDKAFVKEIINKTVKTNRAVEGLRELIELQAKIDSAPPGMQRSQMLGELERREQALRDSVLNAMLYDDSGKAINESEAERHRSMMPAKGWFTNGSNRAIIAQTLNQKLNETNDLLRQTTNPILSGDRAYGTFTQHREMGPAELIESDLIKNDKDKVEPTPADIAYGKVKSPDAGKATDGKAMNAKTDARWSAYVDYAGLDNDDKRRRAGNDGATLSDAVAAADESNPDKAFVELSNLYELSKTGNPEARKYIDDLVGDRNPKRDADGIQDYTKQIDPRQGDPEFIKLQEYARFISDLDHGVPMTGYEAFIKGTRSGK